MGLRRSKKFCQLPEPVIRPAQFSDLVQVRLIEEHSFLRPWTQSEWHVVMGIPTSAWYVLLMADHLVGFAVWGYHDIIDCIDVWRVAVHPVARRQGLGTAMLRWVEQWSRPLRVPLIRVKVAVPNQEVFLWLVTNNYIPKGLQFEKELVYE